MVLAIKAGSRSCHRGVCYQGVGHQGGCHRGGFWVVLSRWVRVHKADRRRINLASGPYSVHGHCGRHSCHGQVRPGFAPCLARSDLGSLHAQQARRSMRSSCAAACGTDGRSLGCVENGFFRCGLIARYARAWGSSNNKSSSTRWFGTNFLTPTFRPTRVGTYFLIPKVGANPSQKLVSNPSGSEVGANPQWIRSSYQPQWVRSWCQPQKFAPTSRSTGMD